MATAKDTTGHSEAPGPVEEAGPPVAHDPWVYRLAVGGVSAALVTFLIAGAIIGAAGEAKAMNQEYWTLGAALAGALVGIIAPSPRQKREAARSSAHPAAQAANPAAPSPPPAVSKEERRQMRLASVAQPLLLIATLIASLLLASEFDASDAAVLRTLAAGAAGGLLGMLVPNSATGAKG